MLALWIISGDVKGGCCIFLFYDGCSGFEVFILVDSLVWKPKEDLIKMIM